MQIIGSHTLLKFSELPPGSFVLAELNGSTYTCVTGKTSRYIGLFNYFCVPLDPPFGEPFVSPPIMPVAGDLPVIDVSNRFFFRPDLDYKHVAFANAFVDGDVVVRADGMFMACPFICKGVNASKVLVNIETGEIANSSPLVRVAVIRRWALALRYSDFVNVSDFSTPPDLGGGADPFHRHREPPIPPRDERED